MPVIFIADSVAGIPELRGHSRVKRVFVHLAQLTIFNFPGTFHAELEIEPLIVDRPRLVGIEENAVVGIGNKIIEFPLTRFEVDVGHTN